MIKIRIFIAIDFDKGIKSYFEDIKHKVDNYCIKGNFTDINNFHLTLQFIGELEQFKVSKLSNALQECVSKQDTFSITLDRLGSFKKGNANLLWIGINHNENLIRIYEELSRTLRYEEIAFDEKPLKPHITLGRQVILKKDLAEIRDLLTIDKLVIPVINITLMESTQVNGKLTYIPLNIFPLNQQNT